MKNLNLYADNGNYHSNTDWEKNGGSPKDILKFLNTYENNEKPVQYEKLSNSINDSGIRNTLFNISSGITPYLNWLIFIAWTAALILIMINGLKLMLKSGMGESEIAKVKSRMINLTLGVVLISGIYIFIKIIVSIFANILGE